MLVCTFYFAYSTNICVLGARHCFKHFTGISSITLYGVGTIITSCQTLVTFFIVSLFIKNLNNLFQKQILLGMSHVKWGTHAVTEKEEVVQGTASQWKEISSVLRVLQALIHKSNAKKDKVCSRDMRSSVWLKQKVKGRRWKKRWTRGHLGLSALEVWGLDPVDISEHTSLFCFGLLLLRVYLFI